jgi:hypothetical protein
MTQVLRNVFLFLLIAASAAAQPTITSISPTTAARSGRGSGQAPTRRARSFGFYRVFSVISVPVIAHAQAQDCFGATTEPALHAIIS